MSAEAPRPGGLLRRLVSESAIYGLGGVAAQSVPVLLVPVYANVLGPANQGVNAIVTSTLSMGLMIVGLALPQAFLRWYLRESETDAERAHVVAAGLTLRVATAVAGSTGLAVLLVPLVQVMYGDLDHLPIFLVIPVVVLADSITSIPMAYLRARRRPQAYVVVSFCRALVGATAVVVLVVWLRVGIVGVVGGSAIGAAVTMLVGAAFLRGERDLRLAWDGALARRMLAFSLPLVPAAIAGWTLNLADRYVLQLVLGADAEATARIGVYSIGYTAGLLINALVIQPFGLAWGAAYWELSRGEDARRAISRVLTAFTAVAVFAAVFLSAFGTDAVRLLLVPGYADARFVVPFSAFAYVCYGIFTIVTTGLNLESQTRRLPLPMAAAAALGIALDLALIPFLGIMGAAAATLVSYGFLATYAGRVSQRHYPVSWQLGRVAVLLGSGMALSAAALLGPDVLAWRAACFLAFPVLAIGFGAIRVSELRDVVLRIGPRRP